MWSIDEYCQKELTRQKIYEDWSSSVIDESSRTFLQSFELSTIHPFCQATKLDDFYLENDNIPPMGPLLVEEYHVHYYDIIITHMYRIVPALVAMSELWLRLLAAVVAPVGITYFLYEEIITSITATPIVSTTTTATATKTSKFKMRISLLVVGTIASSIVLLTDTLYVLEYGPNYGLLMIIGSSILGLRACSRHQLSNMVLVILTLLKMITIFLIYHPNNNHNTSASAGTITSTTSRNKSKIIFGNPMDAVHYKKLQEGLYYTHNNNNEYIHNIVKEWPIKYRQYSKKYGATPWMPTGDSRTGLPFLLNKIHTVPKYHRLWLETSSDDENEYIALDISFPKTTTTTTTADPQNEEQQGEKEYHSNDKPIYLLLHGLNGGSHEEYVMEFVNRRNKEGSTCIVMIARGLMDLPIRGWNIFHGARIDDVHATAQKVRHVINKYNHNNQQDQQVLAGVGYSMGAIVLSNYIARTGTNCALDVGVAISGGLDMRYENDFYRAQRLWQPMLAKTLRDTFLVNKWGERVRKRLSLNDLKQSMRAVHVTEIDKHAVAPYNGFDNVTHYYMEMSALGDIPLEAYRGTSLPKNARIHNIAIPFLVVHALDDPLVTWKTVAANDGLLHPTNLTSQVRTGNLLILLTKAGGHVGWPLGWFPFIHKWKWMNNVAMTFVEAVQKVSRQQQQQNLNQQCTDPDTICDKEDADASGVDPSDADADAGAGAGADDDAGAGAGADADAADDDVDVAAGAGAGAGVAENIDEVKPPEVSEEESETEASPKIDVADQEL